MKNYLEAYPVFVMYNELERNGLMNLVYPQESLSEWGVPVGDDYYYTQPNTYVLYRWNDDDLFEVYVHGKWTDADSIDWEFLHDLDKLWEISVDRYQHFLTSPFNKNNRSEFDCIEEYVKSLIK